LPRRNEDISAIIIWRLHGRRHWAAKDQRVRVAAGVCRSCGSDARDVRHGGAGVGDWHGSPGIVRCSAQRRCREEGVGSRSSRIWPRVGDYLGGERGEVLGIPGSVLLENLDFRFLIFDCCEQRIRGGDGSQGTKGTKGTKGMSYPWWWRLMEELKEMPYLLLPQGWDVALVWPPLPRRCGAGEVVARTPPNRQTGTSAPPHRAWAR